MAETEPIRRLRERLYAAIEEIGSSEDGSDDDLAGTVLVGFMVIAEWRGPGGAQWLSKISGDHADVLPSWRQRGYAAEVLHEMWGTGQEDGE